MNNSDLLYKVALTMIKGVGPQTVKYLISYLGDIEAVFNEKSRTLSKIPGIGKYKSEQINSGEAIEMAKLELDFITDNKIRVVFYTDDFYPNRLKDCKDAPLLLYYKGECGLNEKKLLGIVGTRKMTAYGKNICEAIVQDLASKHPDLIIVSGLAYGVDICAHRIALKFGLKTVGVMGHGHNMIYPASHKSVAEQMTKQGCLLSEYHSKMTVDRNNFVARNRIIAGISDVILLIESADKGGALLTADFANSYNRDVCAVPGKVGDAYSVGCNRLIKDNRAAMVECAEDIEKLMNWDIETRQKPVQLELFDTLSDVERAVLLVLSDGLPMHVDVLSKKVKLPVSRLSPILLEMEFKSLLNCMPGGCYSLK